MEATTMIFDVSGAVTSLFILTAATGEVPKVDIANTCREVIKSLGGETGLGNTTFETCMQSQQSAYKELSENWSKYPAADRQECVNTTGYAPNYVEWLTCFQTIKYLRDAKKDEPKR
jgi:hypothetical protein